jgi:glycosyltransferase involved in cell wall biosynthesis
MKIAILGTRGIPANYGGFETFAEQVAVRLVARGHEVTVYRRKTWYKNHRKDYKGVKLVTLPSVYTKYLDSVSHCLLATLHFMFREKGDIAFYCSSGNSLFTWLARLSRAKVFLHTDGIEWERAKWSRLGKMILKVAEYFATWFPHRLVCDSRMIQEYYKQKHGVDSDYVAYGAEIVERGFGPEMLADLDLEPGQYVLFVSRLEPENNAHVLVRAFEQVKTDKKLVVVGSAPFADEYIRSLKSTTDPRILFPGALYGDIYKALRANAFAYVNAIEVGGTHPAILEAMAAGNCVLVSDISYNLETIGGAGISFRNRDSDDLRDKLQWLEEHAEEAERLGTLAVQRIREVFDWDRIVDDYERIFAEAIQN